MNGPSRSQARQKGAVLVLVGISLAVLIGFLGIVIDLGRLFVTKTELQSAMDACALAASAELRPGVNPPDPQAIARAVSAGITAGTRNSFGFQQTQVPITGADIYFSDRLSDNSTTFPFGYVASAGANPSTARYALCARSQGGIASWFMQVLQGFLGQPATPSVVGAWATATQMSAQVSCALPIGLCKLPAGTPADPFAGMTVGQWLTSKLSQSATGSFDWVDFTPPGGGASELANIIKGTGQCNLPPTGTPVGEQGNITSLDFAWNTRFGIYHGSETATSAPPDFTGYAYTPTNWPTKFDAFGGTSSSGVPNFQTARGSNMAYQGGAGISLQGGGWNNSTSGDLATKGADRRLVTVPVVDCTHWAASNPQQVPVLGYACVLMLHPMQWLDAGGSEEVWLEFRGASNDPSSPCNTSGLAGGTIGPMVPVLVH
jgi:Putative Flp pilus-assembly TadE/G-like